MKTAWILLPLWLILLGCDEKPMVNVYHKEILKTPPTCLALQVVPSNPTVTKTLQKMYAFTPLCDYRLDVSFKEGIHCNSTQNAASSALGHFPHSYLKMEIRKGFSLQYSYYIDLSETVSANDVKKGFSKINDDLQLF